MKRTLIPVLLFLFSILFVCGLMIFCDEEIVNRVVVIVDEDIITLYDLQKAAVWNGSRYEDKNPQERRDLAEQLVNRYLIFQEINKTGGIALDRDILNSAIHSIKKGNPDPGFSDIDIEEYLKSQLLIQAFSSQRFAPLIKISEEDIREYYNSYVGNNSNSSSSRPSFSEVFETIKALLEQRAINGFLKDWLDKQKLIHKIYFLEPL
jgi:hypothetical protein